MQMLLCAVLIDAAHAALEDREITFNRIGRYVAARIFLVGVIDGFVRREFLADTMIEFAFVGVQPRFAIDVVQDDVDDRIHVRARHMKRATFAAEFDQGDDNALIPFRLANRFC